MNYMKYWEYIMERKSSLVVEESFIEWKLVYEKLRQSVVRLTRFIVTKAPTTGRRTYWCLFLVVKAGMNFIILFGHDI